MERIEPDAAEDAGSREAGAFPLVGGALALDLVNTEVVVRGKRRDLLTTPDDAAQWWQAACRHHPEAVEAQAQPVYDAALFDALRELRAALRGIFTAVAEGGAPREADVGLLNTVLSTGRHALRSGPDGALLPTYRARDTREAAVLLPIALSAFRLLTTGNTRRLHKCDNDRCILLLYDTTRSATRRWCSVACKDRARKMKRYRQARAGKQGGPRPE